MAYVQHRVPCCRLNSKNKKGPLFNLILRLIKSGEDHGFTQITLEEVNYINSMIDLIGDPASGYIYPNQNYPYDLYDEFLNLSANSSYININRLGIITYIDYYK